MVEFLRLKLITGDDLSATLWTWRADMEAAMEEFLRNVDAATQTSTILPSKNAVMLTALHKYREIAQLRLALPLAQLDAACEVMENFIRFRLKELQSQQETKILVEELSSKITNHQSRVRGLICSEPLRHPKVIPLVLVGMAADRPLESNFFPGLLEGLLGRLGIDAPGEGNPPTSSREGAGCLWSSAINKAISQIEQREVNASGAVGLPQGLDLHYEEDFLKKRSHQIPLVFLDPLFIPNMMKAVYKVVKPPVVPKVLPSTSSREVLSTSNWPEDGGPELEVLELEGSAPSTPRTSPLVWERVAETSSTDSDKAYESTPEEERPRSLKVRIPLGPLKRGSKAVTGSSKDGATPSKVWKELEVNEAEATALTGPSEAALQKAWLDLYEKDLLEVKEVHAWILSLEEGEEASQEVLDSSPSFQLRQVADKTHPPTVIG